MALETLSLHVDIATGVLLGIASILAAVKYVFLSGGLRKFATADIDLTDLGHAGAHKRAAGLTVTVTNVGQELITLHNIICEVAVFDPPAPLDAVSVLKADDLGSGLRTMLNLIPAHDEWLKIPAGESVDVDRLVIVPADARFLVVRVLFDFRGRRLEWSRDDLYRALRERSPDYEDLERFFSLPALDGLPMAAGIGVAARPG